MQRMFSEIRTRLRALFFRRDVEQELDDELRFHLEMQARELEKQGLSKREAARAARLSFGGVEGRREECRDARGVRLIEDFFRDLRLGARSLRSSPTFLAASLASLGLGVAATIVIFAVVDAVVIRPLPYGEPQRLVQINEITPEGDLFSTSDLNVLSLRERTRSLDGVAVTTFPLQQLLYEGSTGGSSGSSAAGGGDALSLLAMLTSGNLFDVLGVAPALGRAWSEEETAPGQAPRLVVLSHSFWQQTLGADQGVVGSTLRLGGEPWTVLGVLPSDFAFGTPVDLYVPYVMDLERPRGDRRLSAYARLADHTTVETAQTELESIYSTLAREHGVLKDWGVRVRSLSSVILGRDDRTTSYALAGSVLLVLLLSCANVSGLLLARASARANEIDMRTALGAGRGRLVRQLLTESLLLGLLGTLVGVAIAAIAVPALRELAVGALPRIESVVFDLRVAGVAATLTLLTTVLFGTVPAIVTTARRGPGDSLRTRSSTPRIRSALVVGQLAAALLLLSSSLLLVVSYGSLDNQPLGFDVEDLIAMDITLPSDHYPEGSRKIATFYDDVLDRVRQTPGVEQAAANTMHPFRGPTLANTVATPEATEMSQFIEIGWRSASPGLFRTMGTPLLRGRDFRDNESQLVAVLSASLAQRLFGDEEALGQRVRWLYPDGPLATVIGVVADVRDFDVTDGSQPLYYWHQSQMAWPDMTLLLRASADLSVVAPLVTDAVRQVDPQLPPPDFTLVSQSRNTSIGSQRLNVQVFSIFAAAALLIAGVGLYGIVSFSAASRRAEMGLRVALGALPHNVTGLLVRQGAKLLVLGLGIGLGAVWAGSRLVQSLLFETSALDPKVLIIASALLAALALFASWLPAHRAAKASPLDALRVE